MSDDGWPGDAAGRGRGDPPEAQAAMDDEPALADEPAADDEPALEAVPEAEPEPDLAPGGRAVALRLARLHLRMGSLALARAELESYAAVGSLDEAALLDLAEARWRTGDLAGAGDAANAAIGRGVDDPLAYVIAAEAVGPLGRQADARRLAAMALDGLDTTLDAVFAGMPRGLVWPGEPELDPGSAAVLRAPEDVDRSPASAAAAEAFAGGRGALAAGDVAGAALRLSIAMRLEPNYAHGVLTAIGDRGSAPLLSLVAGDALRLLGREQDALEAWDRARDKPPGTGVPDVERDPQRDDGEPG